MTLLGCMALGKGIIVSKVSSVTDYLQEEALLLETNNPQALAKEMQCFLDNPEIVVKLGQKAKAKVEKSFTEVKMAKSIYQHLQEKKLI